MLIQQKEIRGSNLDLANGFPEGSTPVEEEALSALQRKALTELNLQTVANSCH